MLPDNCLIVWQFGLRADWMVYMQPVLFIPSHTCRLKTSLWGFHAWLPNSRVTLKAFPLRTTRCLWLSPCVSWAMWFSWASKLTNFRWQLLRLVPENAEKRNYENNSNLTRDFWRGTKAKLTAMIWEVEEELKHIAQCLSPVCCYILSLDHNIPPHATLYSLVHFEQFFFSLMWNKVENLNNHLWSIWIQSL